MHALLTAVLAAALLPAGTPAARTSGEPPVARPVPPPALKVNDVPSLGELADIVAAAPTKAAPVVQATPVVPVKAAVAGNPVPCTACGHAVETRLPVGFHLRAWNGAMAARGRADRYSFYRNEWLQGSANLGPSGSLRLSRIVATIVSEPYPVILEPEGVPALDAARKARMVELLTVNGVVGACDRVIVAHPGAEGWRANEPVTCPKVCPPCGASCHHP